MLNIARDGMPRLRALCTPKGPFGATVDESTAQWAESMGLIRSPQARQHLLAARTGWFVACVYPSADEQVARLTGDWITWLDCLDDHNDDTAAGIEPDQLDETLALMATAIESPLSQPVDFGGPLGDALVDLLQRTERRAQADGYRRLRQHVGEYLVGNVCQAAHRRLGQYPDPDYYAELRRQAGGILLTFDLVELSENAHLPASLYYSRVYQRLLRTAADVVCWTNDLLTIDKEIATGDVLNLVLVVRETYRVTQQEAMERVAALIDDRVADFFNVEADLDATCAALGTDGEQRRKAAKCLAGLAAWMRGHLEWGLTTGRYHPPTADEGVDYLNDLLVPHTHATEHRSNPDHQKP